MFLFYFIVLLIIFVLFVFLFLLFLFLSRSGLSLHRLGEVRAHETLKVEISQLITLLELEKRCELSIRVDFATILVVLELVGTDVSVDVASDCGASHLSTLLLSKERSKLIADSGGLDKSRGLSVARLSLALGVLLISSLELALPLLL
jgi:hypothetical protein